MGSRQILVRVLIEAPHSGMHLKTQQSELLGFQSSEDSNTKDW